MSRTTSYAPMRSATVCGPPYVGGPQTSSGPGEGGSRGGLELYVRYVGVIPERAGAGQAPRGGTSSTREAALERAADQLGPLAVLRHVLHAEQLEQRVQVALDGVDAHHELLGDLAVRG